MSSHSPSRSRRGFLFGLVLLLLPILVLPLGTIWQWADFDPWPAGGMDLAGKAIALACWLTLPVWLVFFSGLGVRVKLWLSGAMLLLVGAAVAAVDSIHFDGYLWPIPRYRWQSRPADLLDAHIEQHQKRPKLPPIDLTVDVTHDFPRYRGVRGDGKVITPEPLDWNWKVHPPKQLWRHPCGGGFAGFAVAGNVAVTVEQRHAQEAVVCYDRATGRERWVHAYTAQFRNPTGNGPRATPTIADGAVYSLGAAGRLVCLDGASGRCKWWVNILDDNQARLVTWGMTSSPLVVGEMVIVNPGVDPGNNAGRSLAAYRCKDGVRVWGAGTYGAGYSSPQKARLAGRDQVLIFDAGGLASFDPDNGKELWRYPWQTSQDMNITQPLLLDEDRVFIASERSNGGAALKITRLNGSFAVQPVWANRNLCSKFANPVLLGGAIYGLSNGRLVCIDARTGSRLWRGPAYGHGQILTVGGAVLVLSERGFMAVVAADVKLFREVARLEVLADQTWNTPALAGRQLFVRNNIEMACFELPVLE